MIPILHIVDFFSVLFCFFAARKLFLNFRRTGNLDVGDFTKAYIALGLFFLFLALLSFVKDPKTAQVFFLLSYIPGIISPAALLDIALRSLGYYLWVKYVDIVTYCFAVVLTVINILYFSPAIIRIAFNGLIYQWIQGTPFWIQMSSGIFLAIVGTGCASLFLLGAKRAKEKALRIRGLLIGGGILILIIGAATYYSISILFPATLDFLIIAISVLDALLGLIIMFIGVSYNVGGRIKLTAYR